MNVKGWKGGASKSPAWQDRDVYRKRKRHVENRKGGNVTPESGKARNAQIPQYQVNKKS